MTSKADHVREAMDGPAHGHHCHWPGCEKYVAPAAWGCRTHWYKLPPSLRRKVWAAYRPGQEQDKRPSLDYLVVAREVQEWIAGSGLT